MYNVIGKVLSYNAKYDDDEKLDIDDFNEDSKEIVSAMIGGSSKL